MKPKILILHASGANRDSEAARACELAGGAPTIVHINQLRRGEQRLTDAQMLLLPGGFSYGDALGAGARLALDIQIYFHDELHAFVDSGRPVLGICNGFQTLVKAGILPGAGQGPAVHTSGLAQGKGKGVRMAEMGARRVTLTENASGRFECRWVYLQVNPQATAGFLTRIDGLIFCPVAHGEGNFQVKNSETLADLQQRQLIAFRYVDAQGRVAGGRYPLNPNGSVDDIAGICNLRGNVVGLMPHPEDHILPIQNPLRGQGQLGLALFQSMVESVV